MKQLYTILIFSAVSLLAGCINNDIPLPYIKGEILKFEIAGQIESTISPEKRNIKIVLSDTVNIRASLIKLMDITEEAKATVIIDKQQTSIIKGSHLNLTCDTNLVITTYQEYPWTLTVTQPIDRHITLQEGQMGDAQFSMNSAGNIATVTVSNDVDLYNVIIKEVQLGPSIATITPDPRTICDYSRAQKFVVTYFDVTEEWTIRIQKTDALVTSGLAEAWGLFAYLNGSVKPNSNGAAGFEYKKESESAWKFVEVKPDGSKIRARLTGLTPNTPYVFRAKLGTELAAEVKFTTETTPSVQNMNFDTWTLDGKKWFPNATAANSFWASGNEGVTIAGKSNTTPAEGADAVKGKAVRMETFKVMGTVLAAGNIFTGIYKGGVSLEPPVMRTYVIFGRPYTGRPTKLSGWYKYSPKVVNMAFDPAFPFPDFMGKPDWCHIYARLENWGDFETDPATGVDIRPSNPKVVGYGEFKSNQEVTKYAKFEFEIKYSDTQTKPTHIVLIATPSVNGGDFCGGVGSVLYVDEFEFGFE